MFMSDPSSSEAGVRDEFLGLSRDEFRRGNQNNVGGFALHRSLMLITMVSGLLISCAFLSTGSAAAGGQPQPPGIQETPPRTLNLSSYSADATQVTYTLSFVATSGLTRDYSTITVAGSNGTAFQSSRFCDLYTIADDTTNTAGCESVSVSGSGTGKTSTTGPTLHIITGVSVAAGDVVTVKAEGVRNPAGAGKYDLKLSTSSDPTAVLVPFTLVNEQKVTLPVWAALPSSPDAIRTADISFRSTGGLTASSSTIIVNDIAGLPAGCAAYDLIDDTTRQFNGCQSATLASRGGEQLTIQPRFQVNPGDEVTIIISGVKHAPGPSTSLKTSSDPVAVALGASRLLVTAKPSLSLTSNEAAARGVVYSVSFGVTRSAATNGGTISLSAPPGTIFPSAGCGTGYLVTDDNTETTGGCVNFSSKAHNTSSNVNLLLPVSVKSGDVVTVSVVALNVANAGSYTFRLSTTLGVNASFPLQIKPADAVHPVAMNATSHSESATEVSYVLTFVPQAALGQGDGWIQVELPPAMKPPSTSCNSGFLVADVPDGIYNACPEVKAVAGSRRPGVIDEIIAPFSIEGGQLITLRMDGVGNPKSPGIFNISLATSSDPKPVKVPVKVTFPTAVQ